MTYITIDWFVWCDCDWFLEFVLEFILHWEFGIVLIEFIWCIEIGFVCAVVDCIVSRPSLTHRKVGAFYDTVVYQGNLIVSQ